MQITGFRNYDWEEDGFYYHIDPSNTFLPSIEPTVIFRPGTWATFGIPQVGAMTIVGGFGYKPGSFAESLGPEGAFQRLFGRLDVIRTNPGEIRGIRNSPQGDLPVVLSGMLQVSNASSTGLVDFRDANFVCTRPFFESQGWFIGGSVI